MARDLGNASRNVDIVRRLYDAMIEDDFGAVVCSLDDDIVLRIPPVMNDVIVREILDADYNPAGLYAGLGQVRRLLARLKQLFDLDSLELHSFEGDRHRVVVSGHVDAWFRPTGRHYAAHWVHELRLKRGKVSQLDLSGVPVSAPSYAA